MLTLVCSGLAGRLLDRGNVLLYEGRGDKWDNSPSAKFDRSNTAFSGMFGSILSPLQETGYDSSIVDRRGLRLRPEVRGDTGLRGTV